MGYLQLAPPVALPLISGYDETKNDVATRLVGRTLLERGQT